ncbi:dUTP diphosphatase [Rhodospirillum rubrum]|uniref:dUTP diphosphatase n=1 Tax=Rhodospirillum rubrum (strain ATCC 11170 / ATH 1.1.1 / DSM 467 / LMG 4362 / NCIMB 8255 / S1) TaxID=269796 RepID=Q2RQK7_RHORT|nr:dUTP diphosphatase [Rhodospirillum rubrum]ABC23588.1 deoxyuridine 5'-triphosphate nucleotidohydrolase [Rhodospirillum rubrum ATCC 11170]AEO49326.1 deoxyuridine 5'-triphosphate nucleotidohydrolase [Rhodospirillum rubrum F11]MBK1663905.1 dUTP diphosphatase [Rhodospirillum rubrum]MBK1678249.1 dUTP diphosphatase [Rhodospirillum rubrum]MBK5955263.1 deoxyuridine 5'-triphosphate nucleotidohydrolase [Rhodospirillum rubrum]
MLQITYLPHYDRATFGPVAYAKPGDAGFDLRAAIAAPITIEPGDITLVPAGIAMAVPEGYEIQVRSRSGLSLKGLIVANAPGTVDSGYRGEFKVILTNIGRVAHTVAPGDRIAQAVLAAVAHMPFVEVAELPPSERGSGGFGSTGVSVAETPRG